MPKRWFFFSLVFVLMLPVAASAFTINDVVTSPPYTQAEVWRSGQSSGYAGSGTFQDAIGNQFATDSITINLNPFTVSILTNNQPGGWVVSGKNWGVADLAINFDAGTAAYDAYTLGHFPGAVSRFELGIDMQAYAAGTPQQAGAGSAWGALVHVWETSFAQADPVNNINYGGAYKSSNAPAGSELSPVEVRMLDYTPLVQGNISWVVNDIAFDINNALPDYLITITFPGIAAAAGRNISGALPCAAMISRLPPIPGSLVLLGSALIGLVGVGLRKKA